MRHHAGQVRDLRALRCDPVAAQAAARLESCAGAPCGSAACPMCRTMIDPYLMWSAYTALQAAEERWLVFWSFVPVERGEGGLAELQPAPVRVALADQLGAADLSEQPWWGRMALQAYLPDARQSVLNYSVAIGAVACAPAGVDVNARLRAHRGADSRLHLFRAQRLSSRDDGDWASSLGDLYSFVGGAPTEWILEAPGPEGGEPNRRERRARQGLVAEAERVMVRHWAHHDYADLLIGAAADDAQVLLTMDRPDLT